MSFLYRFQLTAIPIGITLVGVTTPRFPSAALDAFLTTPPDEETPSRCRDCGAPASLDFRGRMLCDDCVSTQLECEERFADEHPDRELTSDDVGGYDFDDESPSSSDVLAGML